MDRNWLDIQHRGFSAYLEQTQGDENCQRLNRTLSTATGGKETVHTVLLDCLVNTDWIEQIEQALPFIENALRQNRQFLLRQGETVPLEKAKRVSRESVEHLSRHSELITSDPRTPERIYIAENVDTVAVYENRFLYMLLRYVQDFAGQRHQRISALASSFSSEITFSRQLQQGNRQISFQLEFSETSQGAVKPQIKQQLQRIQAIEQALELLLRTELMKEVARTPLLKPPISRTNVLLHDPNFRVAYELYSYLSEYTGDGFEKQELFRCQGAPSDEMRQDLCNLVSITSYLSYCSGFRRELENRRRELLLAENQKKLEALQAELGDVSQPVFRYIQGLEQQLTAMEYKAQQLQQEIALRKSAEAKLDAAREQMQALQAGSAKLSEALQAKEQELQTLSQRTTQIQETAELRLRHVERQLDTLRQEQEEKLEQQRLQFQQEYEALGEKYRLASAMNRDLTDLHCCTREEFAELEQEFEAFRRYYEQQWKLTKKQIRKEQLWNK